jgi:hypothetical protein
MNKRLIYYWVISPIAANGKINITHELGTA